MIYMEISNVIKESLSWLSQAGNFATELSAYVIEEENTLRDICPVCNP